MRSPRVTCTAVAGTYPGHSELPEAANNWTQSELGLRNNCPVQFDNRDTNFAYLISLVIPTQVSLAQTTPYAINRGPIQPTATMISDGDLYTLAIFLGSASMVLIVVYHYFEVNAPEKIAQIEKPAKS
uniref:Dolichyl-diphosphooligosaccharide--protein glycosyltransferase subunit 4 n=1 Tax=Bionectria ochroleuca TaxID=29856 RepID=A0A0B7KBB0_BIOOC